MVLNEQRLSSPEQAGTAPGRSVIVKLTQMLGF